jgi:hypothetical protein
MTGRFDAGPVLDRLKDFQRRTVEYAFQRMFVDAVPSRRFLVADEVGLGKTLVARGVIAKAVERLQDNGRRLDIIYICSNADIAAQNVARLNVTGEKAFAKATRLTLLPLEVHNLQKQKINFISFTPGTTFDHGRRSGHKLERRLIYQMLVGKLEISSKGLARLLKAGAGEGWYSEIADPLDFDEAIAGKFRQQVGASTLCGRMRALADTMGDRRRTVTPEMQQESLSLIGELRRTLARCCLDALEPDLVILDEFQRFRDLLAAPDSSPSAELAHALFNYSPDLRVLLLSATPYKMYASQHEDEDHYRDFLATTRFLFNDDDEIAELETDLREFRAALLMMDGGSDSVARPAYSKVRIEERLKRVMCRTERVGVTADLDAMVDEIREEVPVSAEDVVEFRCIDRLSSALGVQDPIEFWRSSPYLLNFMKEYELKRKLMDKNNGELVTNTLRTLPYRTLQKRAMNSYLPVDPANGRLRTLVSDIDRNESWRLLWVPPSMPYWHGEGAYSNADGFTKTLVFSSWNVVPDAIAGLLSYYVESKSVGGLEREHRYDQLTKQIRPRLRFPALQDGSFPGMNALALAYPCQTLASVIDPLHFFLEANGPASLDEARAQTRNLIDTLLRSLLPAPAVDALLPDRRWYWVALILLDRKYHPTMRRWCSQSWAMARRSDDLDTPGGFGRHVQHWLEVWDGADLSLGRIPEDLVGVLADMALAGPAVCAYRSLRRVAPSSADIADDARSAAVHVAEGLRSQFNAPEAVAMLQQSDDEDAYWQRVLHYSAQGNLQAVLDEYVHLQYEAEASSADTVSQTLSKVAESIFSAAAIRTSQLRPDFLRVTRDDIEIDSEPLSLRCRYAVRYGQAQDEDGAIARKEVVRAAFNSPFRPFVLASTSVGQEGLDFHSWCHSIVHWNLPSNPVDLEQREGRVHRYKGHAVRRNVATANRLTSSGGDPWERLFTSAQQGRAEGVSDLVPFWIYEITDGAKIERRVFNLPMSKDESRLRRLKSSLALYRMVFGQPRQDDLLEHLLRRFNDRDARAMVTRWRINLEPD